MSQFMSVAAYIGGMDVRVTGTYFPGDPGRLSGPPEHCYPAEPAEFHIDTASAEIPGPDGADVRINLFELPQAWLAADFWDDLSDAACVASEDQMRAYADEAADMRREEEPVDYAYGWED